MEATTSEMRTGPVAGSSGHEESGGYAGSGHDAYGRFDDGPPNPAWRAVAYLSDPSAVDGPATLREQLSLVEGSAASMPAVLMRLYVDSGWCDGDAVAGPALRRMLTDARSRAFDAVVVEHVSRFAPDYLDALRVAVALGRAGVEVVEARGGPVALRQAAVDLFEESL